MVKKLSQNLWIKRKEGDKYFFSAKAYGYRARSVYKLLEINKKFKILKEGISVADLGAAPGSWSQMLAETLFRKSKNSNRFVFLSNDIGIADSLEGNLSTVNAFSLGGLNFKGFDYRGIGTKVDGIYIGGNKFFTSTIGYGGSFIFDDKDNILLLPKDFYNLIIISFDIC